MAFHVAVLVFSSRAQSRECAGGFSPFEYLMTCLIGVQGPLGCLSGPASRRISADGTDEMDISLVGDFAAWVEESITSSGERLHFLMLSLHKISQHQYLSVSEL